MTDTQDRTDVRSILFDMERSLRMVENAIAGLGAIREHYGRPDDMIEWGVFAMHEIATVQFRNVMDQWQAALAAAPGKEARS